MEGEQDKPKAVILILEGKGTWTTAGALGERGDGERGCGGKMTTARKEKDKNSLDERGLDEEETEGDGGRRMEVGLWQTMGLKDHTKALVWKSVSLSLRLLPLPSGTDPKALPVQQPVCATSLLVCRQSAFLRMHPVFCSNSVHPSTVQNTGGLILRTAARPPMLCLLRHLPWML